MKNSFDYINTTRIRLAILMAIMLATVATITAEANAMYKLEVNYTNGAIISGPLSFGLSALPTSVTATFTLGPGQPSTEPGEEDDIYFDDDDITSANVTFGDATWDEDVGFEQFDMLFDGSVVSSLDYRFLPITTQATVGIIIIEFPAHYHRDG